MECASNVAWFMWWMALLCVTGCRKCMILTYTVLGSDSDTNNPHPTNVLPVTSPWSSLKLTSGNTNVYLRSSEMIQSCLHSLHLLKTTSGWCPPPKMLTLQLFHNISPFVSALHMYLVWFPPRNVDFLTLVVLYVVCEHGSPLQSWISAVRATSKEEIECGGWQNR